MDKDTVQFFGTLWGLTYQRLRNILALDTRSLALFRVAIAWATLWDLGNRLRDLEVFYTDSGVMPRSLVLSHFTTDYWASLHMFSGAAWAMFVLFVIHAIFAFLMLIGYRTNLFTFLTWCMTCSLQTRNIIVFHSGDNVHRMALLWGSLLPLGACFSVDNIIAEREAAVKGTPKPKTRKDYSHFSAAALCFTFQILVTYWAAHRYKTAPEWRQTGVAGWMAIQLDFFRRPFGQIITWMPTFSRYSTLGVLYWQKYGCYFFFSPIFSGPVRAFGVLGFYFMHLTFFLTMRLGLFGWGTVGAIVGLIPGWVWDSGVFPFFWTKKRRDFKLYFKEGCSLCFTLCQIATTFFLMPGTEVFPIPDGSESPPSSKKGHDEEDNPSEVVVQVMKPRFQWKSDFIVAQDQYGRLHRNWDALIAIAEHSPLFWYFKFFLRIQKIREFGNELLELFHDHSGLKEVVKPRRPPVIVSRESQIKDLIIYGIKMFIYNLVGLVFLYMLFCVNSQGTGFTNWKTPPSLYYLTWAMHFPQNWGMFSPRPPDVNWWYNIKGELDNGTLVELFTYGGVHSLEPAPYTGLTTLPNTIDSFKNHRWFKLFEVGINSHRSADTLRLSFGRWLCREYNKIHRGSQALYKHDIIFVSQRLNMAKMDGSRYPPQSSSLWKHQCYFKPGEKKK